MTPSNEQINEWLKAAEAAPGSRFLTFATLAAEWGAKQEREACAQLCDYAATECEYGGDGWYAAKTLAAAIRARGTLERLNDAASQSD